MTKGGNTNTTRTRTILLFVTVAAFVLFVAFGLSAARFAGAVSFEDVSQTLGLGTSDLKETAFNIIRWALGLLGLVAVILLLYGGYVWMTAAGREERVKRAKRIIINALIGLVIILLSWAIVSFVLSVAEEVTGGGSGCVDGEEQGCYDCVGGDWVYDPNNGPQCVLPVDSFEIRNIVTSCENPPDYRDNVYRCSDVTVIFNKVLDLTTVEQNTMNDNLIVEECDATSDFNNCNNPSQPSPPFNTVPPSANEIEYSGASPKGDRAEIVALGKAFTFHHAQGLFRADTFYRLKVPKASGGIKSIDGKELTACEYVDGTPIPGCEESATYYGWIFRVGDQTDESPPTLEASYPEYVTDPDYPDRNVNRNAILTARFSEAIAPWTITEDNIKLYGFDPNDPPDENGNGGTRLGTPIDGLPPDPDNYDVYINNGGDGYELVFKNGFQLDAFGWYEIEVNNLMDLCSNIQTPAPLTWRFETNGVGVGIATVYPPDGFQFACPTTEIFARFNTSMYDPATSGCTVNPPLGFVTSGTINPNIPRLFEVEDDYPGSGNPNNYCKKYSWRPTSGALNINTNYNASVDTRYQINQAGDMLEADWGFKTATPDTCANPPVITDLSPEIGPAGTCLSVLGNYFDPDGDNQGAGDNDNLTFSGNSALSEVKRWSQRAIVVNAPDIGTMGSSPVQVTVFYDPPINPLTSNTLDFTYEPGTFAGPCLYELNPDNGLRNQGYQLVGEDFNPSSSTKLIHFGAINVPSNWASDTIANSSVPPDAPEAPPPDGAISLVSLENDAGVSNELPFAVFSVPPDMFRVVEFVPDCASACPNADVRARFSEAVDQTKVTNDTVELYRCADESCELSGLVEVATDLRTELPFIDVHFPESDGLDVPDVWYRAVIHGAASGVMSADGNELGDLNYDSDGVGGADSFTWVFKTGTAQECALDSIACQPPVASVPLGGDRGYQGFAYSAPNACDPGGSELDPWDFEWTWSSSDITRVTVNPPTPDPVTTATGVGATLPGQPVEIDANVQSENALCLLTVTTNTCVTDDDCVNNPVPGACSGSRCESGVCTPTVTDISPSVGAVGDWVTVSGCYFDDYVDGQSQVQFLQDPANPDLTGLWPLPSVCGSPGSTWHDREVIVEVPNKRDGDINDVDDVRVTGPVRVIRGTDLKSADSTESFDPSAGEPSPGICKLTPRAGQAGVAQLKVEGQNFGLPPAGPNDRITFYNNTDSGSVVNGSDATWVSDNEVSDVGVPADAENNPGSYPNPPWSGNANELFLENDGRPSNLVNFDVIPPSCTTCSNDNQCGGAGETQGCGESGPFMCCTNRPMIDTFGPVNPPQTCRNAVVFASFKDVVTNAPIAMDRSSINPTTVRLRNVTDGVDVVLNASDFRYPTPSSFQVNPGLLSGSKQFQVTVAGDENINQEPPVPEGVRSQSGVGMFGNKVWDFFTADTICELDRVILQPESFLFTSLGTTQAVSALTYDQNGNPIAEAPGVYDWSWSWDTADPTVATVTNVDAADTTIASAGKGGTSVTATATAGAGWSGTRSGSAPVTVDACENPWPGANPYTDPLVPSTNFSLWYCRDEGGIPSVNAYAGRNDPSQDGVDELVRQFFFENPNVNPNTQKHDAVGMLVYENEERRSPAVWYEKKFGERANAATFKVDGYEAMRIGTTTYIAGTNLSGGTLYANMYVLGYNDDAGDEISTIFQQMLKNLRINWNASEFVYNGFDAVTALAQVRRDADRLGDLLDYNDALVAYEDEQNSFPTLPSGSYIAGMSTSRWPSWLETFGQALREVVPEHAVNHTDPVNDLEPACTDPFDPNTCWDELGKRFFCPDDSHIYAYQVAQGGSQFDMFSHLEYLGMGTWQTGDVNPCSAPSSCPCFNFQLTGVGGGGGGMADLTPPTPPGSLAATAVSDSQIDLNWTLSTDTGGSGVQSYELYRSLDGVNYGSPFAVVAHPTNVYSNTGLAADTTYFYRAKAKDFAGNISDYSNTAQARTLPGGDPIPPGNITALQASAGDGQVTLTWDDPLDNDLAGLKVYYVLGNAGSFARSDGTEVPPDVNPGVETKTVSGLTNGQVYTFGVFSFDEVPNFSPGAFIAATPSGGGGGFSADIQNLIATAGDGEISFSWAAPADPAYTGVKILRRADRFPNDPNDGTTVADVAHPTVQYTDSGLTNGQEYFYKFFAHDAVPNYAPGVRVNATPQAGGFSEDIFFLATPGDSSVFLTWLIPANPAYAGTKILRRIDQYPAGPNDPAATLVGDFPEPTDTYNDTGLVNGTIYYYGAFAHDAVPNYAPGEFAQAKPDSGAPNITGVNVPMSTITLNGATFRWQTDEPATSMIEYGLDPNQYGGNFIDGTLVTDHSITLPMPFAPNTLYHFRVSSSDAAGNTTVDIDHVFVTDAVINANPADIRWEGYFESLPVATWNGSALRTQCTNDCNQYYTCNEDGTADCDDPRNPGIGALTECGALAIADCLDSQVDLPQGRGVINNIVLDAWSGTRLPADQQYTTSCNDASHPVNMPYPNGVWGRLVNPPQTQTATRPGKAGGAPSCNVTADNPIDLTNPLMVISEF